MDDFEGLESLRDPSTIPNAPSLPVHILHQFIGLVAFGICFIPVVVYRTLTWIIPATRPHRSWTLRRSVAVSVGRLYLACTTYLSLPREPGAGMWKPDGLVHRLTGRRTKVKAVVVPPVKDEWIVSIAKAGDEYVGPVKVSCFWTFVEGGVWMEGDENAAPGEKVIMYVNGGSWVMGHPQSIMFPYKFAKISGRRILGVNHRKALAPSTAFPAQLLDLLAGYAYLLSKGFASENIVLIGDSSGGHLVLALSRYLSELNSVQPGCEVGMPGAMLLISPSCDLSHPPCPTSATDFLVPYLNQRVYPSLTRHFVPSAVKTSPYFSPAACGSFAYLATAQKGRPSRIQSPPLLSLSQLSESDKDRRLNLQTSPGDARIDMKMDLHVQPKDALNSTPGSGTQVWIQYSSVENLHADIEHLIERMRGDGVEVDVDRVEGGVHLDAGIAFALGERGEESAWVRLCDAVRRYTR
ncbi:Alpha/Beta hydrolase protein [Irpex rosettiformis]|uniref:Alpha/Beta hydrolase protein n=1 Tax=Irpex rosettiformis TaxID=378272 RepID=A0ACB8U8G0_9APHY|nr:Alpha/Beta hydrolase protein [Irpex rosettiformis]